MLTGNCNQILAQGRGDDGLETTGEGHHGGDMELAGDFLRVLTGAGRSRAPLEAGLLSVQMCLMARESCRLNTFQSICALDELVSEPVPA